MTGIKIMNNKQFWAVMVLCAIVLVGALALPAQAAPPVAPSAPPEVKPCQEINTATLPNGGVITIFYCEPDNSIPYKINSLGFMLNEE